MNKLPPISRPASTKSLRSHNEFQGDDENFAHSKTTKNLKNFTSPFKIPTDEEVFQYCEIERQKKEDRKKDIQEQNIWDKKTATCRNPLKHYKSFQAPIDEKHVTQRAYKQEDKKLIQTALEIANGRKKNTDSTNKKESIVDTLEQKKEMFLVTMSHGIIENEIQRLKNISEDREKALNQSERMLLQDQENFTQYTEKNKKEQEDQEKNAENATKERKEIEAQIKSIQVRMTSLKSEKNRLEENLQVYKEHKEFLDKLASLEWQQKRDKEREQKIEEYRPVWIQKQIERLNEDDHSKQKKSQQKDYKKLTEKEIKDLSAKYKLEVEREAVQEIVEFNDNYPLAFKEPKHLVEYFDKLEQDNLNKIKFKQTDEQKIDELTQDFQMTKEKLGKKVESLINQKDQIQRQIEDVKTHILEMKQRKNQGSTQLIYEEDIKQKVLEIYQLFKDEIVIDDPNLQPTVYILSKVEQHIDYQLKELDRFSDKSIKTVDEARKNAEKARKNKQRNDQKITYEKEQRKKNEKNKEKMMEASKKKVGRQDMRRSAPLMKEVKEEKQTLDNKEEEDKKYFNQDYIMGMEKDLV